ncbi:PEGA domain-containing protein [candidate division WWE3 bacterium]|uniref:PEGA domain-containing protein n=1 Tax=candidate division WWE3 bacterium TaxID=2053526 RepID=A0A3A4ZCF5_UNCKA|nr:MAG: PEGA domain-containing protein [candidate division WWE3 bacterium]
MPKGQLILYHQHDTLYTSGMSVSTISNNNSNKLSNIILYVLAIAGIGLVIYFGTEVLKNLDNLKGKAALTVDVLNTEADVSLNGEKVGTTPYSNKEIAPGENKITISAGGRTYETTIDFIPNDKKYIHTVGIFRDLGISDMFSSGQLFWFEKEKSDNVIRILSEPSDAMVFIDNSEVDNTPYSSDKLSEGEYDLRVEFPGYESQTARINIKKGYTLNISMKLFPVPVPSKVRAFEGSDNLYDLSSDNVNVVSDTQSWASAVYYWNKTRGISIADLGVNKEPLFDYFLDFKGNIFDNEGNIVENKDDYKNFKDVDKGAYLGRMSDGAGLTPEAKTTLQTFQTAAGIGGKKAKVIETGTGWLRVRDIAGLNGTEIARVNVGTDYPVLEETTGWVKIRVSDTVEGWVSADYVEVTE